MNKLWSKKILLPLQIKQIKKGINSNQARPFLESSIPPEFALHNSSLAERKMVNKKNNSNIYKFHNFTK